MHVSGNSQVQPSLMIYVCYTAPKISYKPQQLQIDLKTAYHHQLIPKTCFMISQIPKQTGITIKTITIKTKAVLQLRL